MAKKVYDIKPPKVASAAKKSVAEKKKTSGRVNLRKVAPPVEEKKLVQHPVQRKKEKKPIWGKVFAGVLVLAVIFGVYLFFKLPKATISIWPKVETLSFEQTIVADKSAESVSLEKNIIPAKYFEVSKTVSQDFPATGNASDEGKASGTITIYNKYDPPSSLTLKTGTRFMSDSGKVFTALQKVVVPAAKKSGNKITPGSVQVKVQAVEGGESYNVAPSNFSVPGLKGTAYYYSIYATSSVAMAGGFEGKIKKITDDDIQNAKDQTVKNASEQAIEDLKKQISSEDVLLNDATSSITTEASSSKKSGTVADNFNYNATVKVSALVFKKSDLEEFSEKYISSQALQGQTFLSGSLKTDYSAGSVDVSGGKENLKVSFSGGVYKSIDSNSVALLLFGKNKDQIKELILSNMGEDATNIKVDFWPFWVKSAPNSQKAVKIKLEFNQ